MKGSNTPKPMSPTSRTMSSRRSAVSSSVSRKALRMNHGLELAHGLGIFLGRGAAIVPFGDIRHEIDAMSLVGVEDDSARPVAGPFGAAEGFEQRREIMAV